MKKALVISVLLFMSVGFLFVFDAFQKEQDIQPEPNYHYSYFSSKEFFDDVYARLDKLPETETIPKNIRGMTVNHHLLAPEIMAATIEKAPKDISIVVILAPNHMSLGKSEIVTSAYDWHTPYGILPHNESIIKSLSLSSKVSIEEKPFETEHSITALVSFIKRTLPNTTVVPIILKDSLTEAKSKELAELLNSILPEKTLVIASLDFSHYLPNYVSDFHDVKAREVFEQFDYEGIRFLDIDSKPTALTFLKYLELRKAKKSALLYHTNANEITRNLGSADNTSYLNFVYGLGNVVAEDPTVTILGFGDLMLDRAVRVLSDQNGLSYPFKKIGRFLGGSDVVFANLEGPFTTYPSVTTNFKNKELKFTFDPKVVPVLERYGFNVLGLANNHTYNFGSIGFEQTKKYLKDAGILYYGDPFNKELSVIKEVRGARIAFVGYHEFYRSDIKPVVDEIKRLRDSADFIIVTPHWGNEYEKGFLRAQQQKARAFIDAGADVVVGAHPHVIEPIEIYKNKAIFYSLGNFVFDQNFSFDTTHGLSIGIVTNMDELTYYLYPISITKSEVTLADQETRKKILAEISTRSDVSEVIKNGIINGIIKLHSND